ncbi:MAG: hypothetical protein KAW12_03130 [Candidatus Aminicenantes bacterium]|nr:hypothetical protein [Candidatus Aminicenantes bacterium]
MTDLISNNPLVLKVVQGEANEELLEMLFLKQLPFTEEEYLEALVFTVGDGRYKEKSLALLKDISEITKTNYVDKTRANHRVAYFVLLEALGKKNQNIIAKVIHNQAFPYEFLIKIAEKGQPAMLEALLDNQIKLIAYPQIMDVMELNPKTGNFIKGKIKEIRDFYLQAGAAEEIIAADVLEEVTEVLAGALIEEKKDPEESEDELIEQIKKETNTSLQMINAMSVSERVKLALTGDKTQRAILVKDSNKMVMTAVIESPKLSKDEVGLMIRNKSIPGEIIGKIARNRDWTKDYSVSLGLVQNPKTPVKSALGFIKKLYLRDLRLLMKDKNISPVIRNLAVNFYRQKTKTKGG